MIEEQMYVEVFVLGLDVWEMGKDDVWGFDIDDFIGVVVGEGERIVEGDIGIGDRGWGVWMEVEEDGRVNIGIM